MGKCVEKGYDEEKLKQLTWWVGKGYRSGRNKMDDHKKRREKNNLDFAFFLDYISQYKEMESIIKRQRPVLQMTEFWKQ